MLPIHVSANKFQATVKLPLDSDGKYVSPRILAAYLEKEGITFGIKIKAIKSAYKKYKEDKKISKIVIAQGKVSKHGEDAQIKFANHTPSIGTMRPDGSMDFRNKSNYQVVEANSTIATLIPATPGEPGKNIFGEDVEANPGKSLDIALGDHIQFDEEEKTYTATIAGLLMFQNNKLSISNALTLDAINVESGNIDINQDLVVKNNIQADAKVKVKGNLLVEGSVESSDVYVEGNIKINKGVAHGSEGIMEATGDIELSHATNANLISGKDIYIHSEAHHCKIYAANAVVMTSKTGQLIGGHCSAMNSIQANVIGSSANPDTTVGIGPQNSTKFGEIFKKMRQYEKNVLAINQFIGDDLDDDSDLKNRFSKKYEKINEIRLRQGTKLYDLRKKFKKMLKTFSSQTPILKVLKKSYSKVEILIDEGRLYLDKPYPAKQYWNDEKAVRQENLNEANSNIPSERENISFELDLNLLETYSAEGTFLVDDSDDKTDQKQLDELLPLLPQLLNG